MTISQHRAVDNSNLFVAAVVAAVAVVVVVVAVVVVAVAVAVVVVANTSPDQPINSWTNNQDGNCKQPTTAAIDNYSSNFFLIMVGWPDPANSNNNSNSNSNSNNSNNSNKSRCAK